VDGGEGVSPLDSEPPWASGPGELLRHGIDLLQKDNDTHRRIAMILIDNSVELMMKTFIGLPGRLNGLNLKRTEIEDMSSTFPKLVDGIQSHASDRTAGINLGEIEWFHRLRNQLYHDGNGLTVERAKVELYAEIADMMFRALFGVSLKINTTKSMERFGLFLESWIAIEKALDSFDTRLKNISTAAGMRVLQSEGRIPSGIMQSFEEVRQARNNLVHGKEVPSDVDLDTLIGMAREVADYVGMLFP
jgi:hypothetical protein